MNGGLKIGRLLCDEDIITKRQLNLALQAQVKGDKRTLGEILVAKEFCTLNDITEVIMRSTDENGHEDRQEEISEKIEGPLAKESVEISERTKFTLSVQTIIAAATGIASLVGMWYMLQADIQEAKELPSLQSLYDGEYPSKAPGYNWPTSYEQYTSQVGTLQDDMDEVLKRLDDAEKTIQDLRVQVAKKRNK